MSEQDEAATERPAMSEAHPCICDLYSDPDAKFISRITRLRETNRKLSETNERLRAVLAEREARITSLENLLSAIGHEAAFYAEPDGDDVEALCNWIANQINATLHGKELPDDR